MWLKKSLVFTVLITVLATTLFGCNGSTGGTPGNTASNATSHTPSEPKVVKLAHGFTNGEGASAFMIAGYEWVMAVKEKYEKDNPGNEVKLEFITMADMNTKLMTDYNAGIKHDAFTSQSSEILQHVAVGSIADMTPYFSKWSQEEQKDFNWHPNWGAYEIDKKLYGLPLGLHTRTIAYRKDLFIQAGLDPEKTPKTLDELVEYAQKLTTKDVWGLGLYLGPHAASTEVLMMPLIWSLNGSIFDDNTKMATFNTPEVVQAIQWMYDCVYKYKVTPSWTLSGLQNESLLKPFLAGQFAMAFGIGNYWLADLQNADLISGAYPATANVDDSKVGWFICPEENGVTYANSWGISMASTVADQEETFKLITAAVDKEVIKKFIGFGGFPARKSGYDAPEYKSEFWQKWLDIAATGREAPHTANYNSLKDSLTTAMQEIITGQDDSKIKETLQRYQDEYNNRYGGK